jgi:hypothetical protein
MLNNCTLALTIKNYTFEGDLWKIIEETKQGSLVF